MADRNWKISVIVPIYNSGQYLAACLESLASQTMGDVQILLIDDGSRDDSPRICEEYCRRYPHFSVYRKPNGGLSDARNYGLAKASGRYIAFVDSDDYVEPDFLESLWRRAQEGAQIVCCGYFREERKCRAMHYPSDGSIGLPEFWMSILEGEEIGNFMCNKLFSAELFEQIRFPKGKKYEDMRTLYRLADQAERISVCVKSLYHYVSRKQSITASFNRDSAVQLLEAGEEIACYVQGRYPQLAGACEGYRLRQRITAANELFKAGVSYGDSLLKECRGYLVEHWDSRKLLSRKLLISAWLLRLFPKLYGWLLWERKKLFYGD